jgi:hypothetical protein
MAMYFVVVIEVESIEEPFCELLGTVEAENAHILFEEVEGDELAVVGDLHEPGWPKVYLFLSSSISLAEKFMGSEVLRLMT